MAMKINKTTITRLEVTMSCGCSMYSEFKDTQCKEPLVLMKDKDDSPERVFHACETHHQDTGLTLLKFIISERIDEAIEEAQKAPAVPQHRYLPPDIEEGDTGGVTAASTSIVQSVMKVAKPVAVRPRTADPAAVKTIQRSPEQLARAGAAPIFSGNGATDFQMEEVPEDERYTPHVEAAMDFLDDRESGLLAED